MRRYRVNPLLAAGWRATELQTPLRFTLEDALSNCARPLDAEDFWVLNFAKSIGEAAQTRSQLLAEAVRFALLPEQEVERTLAPLWDVLFVAEDSGSQVDRAVGVWEHFDCKLALEFYAQSLDEGHQKHSPDRSVSSSGFPEADIPLPAPVSFPHTSLANVLYRRRTCRNFNGRSVPLDLLSSVLHRGIARASAHFPPFAVQYHLIVLRAGGLASGSYIYDAARHAVAALRQRESTDLEQDLVQMLIGQKYVKGCAAALLLWLDTASLVIGDPGPAAFRKWLIATGALAQRLIVLGCALGLETFLSAAIHDAYARHITCNRLKDRYVPMHCVAFGYADATNSC